MKRMGGLDPPMPPGVEGPIGLRDGSDVFIRAAHAGDRELLLNFLRTLSPESLELRFFGAMRPEIACDLLLLDGPSQLQLSLIAFTRDRSPPYIIGQAEYVRASTLSPTAEVAFLIGEEWRGRGLGTILLHRLARAATGVGVRDFEARVLPQNLEMLEVFRRSGYHTHEKQSYDEVRVTFPISGSSAQTSMSVPGRWNSPRVGSLPS